jgi:hypothetical protein
LPDWVLPKKRRHSEIAALKKNGSLMPSVGGHCEKQR